jgi:peptidoglycan/LPS O-acetylase OafA/YrhL
MKRIPQLDGVRALAILAVFVHHALHVRLLWSGVDLFFILSGFLITRVLLDAKHHSLGGYFAHFYARRARRILAPYLLTLIVASFFVGLAWARHWYFYLLFTNLLRPLHIALPVAFEPLWSLAVEEQFYLL